MCQQTPVTQPQLLAVPCRMRYEDWAFRETEVRLREHRELQRVLQLQSVLDYTKGIVERMDALDIFFTRYPQFQGRMVFFQIAVASRTPLVEYQAVSREVERRVESLNWKYSYRNWQPVMLVRQPFELETLLPLYRMARFLVVSSLHDGMNLVAKEFVPSQVDCNGVLLLSQFPDGANAGAWAGK
ncbi:MAG: trehalose-6-phosphate synthase [Acidobacteria bacterium]|nr:trehalose-6-phosphate synthase [Acidobacteriota bacterium]